MNILIVDDDKLNLKIAENMLRIHFDDLDIYTCQDPKQVMDLLDKNKIDIILLDIMMPGITGIELIKLIRAVDVYKDIRIIMLTSLTDDQTYQHCFDYGANEFLRKPINKIVFKARIGAEIRARKSKLEVKSMFNTLKDQNSELKNVNKKLKEAQFHLVQSEKLAAIGELAAGVAHEINNPIGYIGSNLDTMNSYLTKMKEFINLIQQEIERYEDLGAVSNNQDIIKKIKEKRKEKKIDFIMEDLEDMIQDTQEGVDKVTKIVMSLRNFARSGKEEVFERCEYKKIIDEVLLIVRNESKYSTEITTEFNDKAGLIVNKGQYSQVVLNIVINGIQAIKEQEREGFGHIGIKSYDEEGYSCLSIADDGPGMAETIVNQIFNPFFTTKDVGVGTGMGLSISHDIIVNKHKGIVDVISEVGKGTEFIIKIPKAQD